VDQNTLSDPRWAVTPLIQAVRRDGVEMKDAERISAENRMLRAREAAKGRRQAVQSSEGLD